MTSRRDVIRGLGAACALAATPAALRADDGSRLLTATDVHVKDYPTVAAIAGYLERLLVLDEPAPAEQQTSTVVDVTNLSDTEVEALLLARLESL